jgi:hypothetical protein
MTDVEKEYQEFWKGIVEKDGVIDIEQIKKELFDFSKLMANASKVYEHVTGHQLSKINYDADVVIALAEDHYNKWTESCVKEAVELERTK